MDTPTEIRPPVLTGHVSSLPPVLTGHVSSLPPVLTGRGEGAAPHGERGARKAREVRGAGADLVARFENEEVHLRRQRGGRSARGAPVPRGRWAAGAQRVGTLCKKQHCAGGGGVQKFKGGRPRGAGLPDKVVAF